MALKLSELLDEPDVLVESAIKKLEHVSGWQSTDVRLLADINNKMRFRLSQLGLDPDDTTGPELYHALQAKFEAHQQSMSLTYGEMLGRIIRVHKDYRVYALKSSAAKDLLRQHPPRKLMKQLSYRSVDSMLKRENIAALYAVLASIESSRWLNVFWKDVARLNPSDFETRDVSVVEIPEKLQSDEVMGVPLLGAVVLRKQQAASMEQALKITKCIHELRTSSALVKLRNVQADFGANLVQIVRSQGKPPVHISLLPISWRTIFHHYGQRKPAEHTEFFGPHILHEDILAHNVMRSLSKVFPVLNWWQGFEHVAKKTEQGVVSLNLHDVIDSQGKDYGERSLVHFRKSLWHEFIDRYFAHPSVEQHFMQQLEPQPVPVVEIPESDNPEQEIRQMMELGV